MKTAKTKINNQRTDLILISAAISQTHVKYEIRLRGRPLIISSDGRIRLMNNYSYIKTRDLNQISFNFLKNYLDFNNQNAIILLWNGNSDKNILQRLVMKLY
ncbi:Uncharacterized protein FWK35_00026562 [Aphis craccivora]|uniref:Uncharacterized protein n=1 Tax=Aphis craccivora TaxID=307492 RepID=A0A6G0VXT0_APHCR|nr:Uncharacterized protein FWK35_00026562 [Aphis craccivora]